LNAAILLDKFDIFDTDKTMINDIVKRQHPSEKSFNLNKHLAFKFYHLASLQKETEDEANLKLGDFYYYGIACNQSYDRAIDLYKRVIS